MSAEREKTLASALSSRQDREQSIGECEWRGEFTNGGLPGFGRS
jgi:hypothetical protein